MTFEEQLNADPPPEVLHPADVELLVAPLARFMGGGNPLARPMMSFTWHGRRDGWLLEYLRWVDDDGERFYLWPEPFKSRAGVR